MVQSNDACSTPRVINDEGDLEIHVAQVGLSDVEQRLACSVDFAALKMRFGAKWRRMSYLSSIDLRRRPPICFSIKSSLVLLGMSRLFNSRIRTLWMNESFKKSRGRN
jgi:hypothetical protein